MSLEQSTPQSADTIAPATNASPTVLIVNALGSDPLLDAAAAVNAVQNHPITQNIANGPVAQSVKDQTAKTSQDFSGLASSKTSPSYQAANGQPLTQYHSFFYTLLTWEHPRATAISFALSVIAIISSRYLSVLPIALKMTYLTLGVTALAEIAGKYVVGTGLATSIRPRQYYKIPKESLEASLDDLEQFINFFVIETQRVLFAENVVVTIAAFAAAFLSFYLIKFVPFWGLALIGDCAIFLGPLVYLQNKEIIDSNLEHATNVVSAQAAQVKDLTVHHTNKGLESVKAYTGDYAAKAQEIMGSARQKIPGTGNTTATPIVKEEHFPSAPRTDLPSAADTTKPVVHAPTEGEPIAVSSQ